MREVSVEREVIGRIAKQLDVPIGKITLAMRLAADLGADSMDFVELEMLIEDELNICFAGKDYGLAGKTVGDYVRLVRQFRAEEQAAASGG